MIFFIQNHPIFNLSICAYTQANWNGPKNLETQTTLTPPTDQGMLLATEFFYFHQVFTISLLADKKYHHFRPVLDAYIEELFGATKADQWVIYLLDIN